MRERPKKLLQGNFHHDRIFLLHSSFVDSFLFISTFLLLVSKIIGIVDQQFSCVQFFSIEFVTFSHFFLQLQRTMSMSRKPSEDDLLVGSSLRDFDFDWSIDEWLAVNASSLLSARRSLHVPLPDTSSTSYHTLRSAAPVVSRNTEPSIAEPHRPSFSPSMAPVL